MRTLNFVNSLSIFLNLFLIIGSVAILNQKDTKSQNYSDIYNSQKNLVSSPQHIFLLSTFPKFCFSFRLEHNFSHGDLKYSLRIVNTKSVTSLPFKIFK